MSTDAVFDFIETESQQQEFQSCIEELKGQRGAQMPALQEAQRIYGYLPIEIMKRLSKELELPLEELYSTATFYAQFTFVPKGEYTISVCMGTACYVKGAGDILDSFTTELKINSGETTVDRKFTLESYRCIGACGLAPVLTVNEEVYGRLSKKKADKVLVTYQNKK
ncbi:NAD(P)H-dependent oxidoreductase subunit E [Enterococcus hulanensis]|uniref:NAD(P)H-dependent oxidoreductase subunit E n=1 Tax=Enterococcus hulanensis TaxID=2559929 RepID=A0ABU3F3V3_9ENTE|nr:NAD(P)H-dependent oxidoreductase subunit E [Enterococcus hulanensis]MDT2601823.1 NAD(P)H-dependent oxidoreductase subunit E [Enterococcus hulanensis]MDT2611208.1 NAD(P)H-dependent oxidoreductase subunit E [Enterococcus hulanensis]MDT2618506.1 NAD(P)H-dependent oxidoreductase subunit E [Enterococcus hulanensis]MDT2629651.1 NAD(P)H-dependent oxidoreductase subunit E [Enterococcus hulanensis]MDT2657383.1 NAD(P)H-dependent oxidoreductase subunit E [Enterococcus hulanensis]